jgi:hypothetical protein
MPVKIGCYVLHGRGRGVGVGVEGYKLECTFLCRILLCRRHRKIEHIDKNSRPIGGMETRGMFYYTYSFLNQSTKSIN